MEFDVGKWLKRSFTVPGDFCALLDYVKSEIHLRGHVSSIKTVKADGSAGLVAEINPNFRDHVIAAMSASISDAAERAAAQMAVVAVTYIEGMLSEFFACLFYYNPAKMHQFLTIGDQCGAVTLKAILDAQSKKEILERLADIAADRATQGKIGAVLDRLDQLTNISLSSKLKTNLVSLFEIRNRIVHEAGQPEVTSNQVSQYFDHMSKLLEHMTLVGLRCGIKINDPTRHDEERQ